MSGCLGGAVVGGPAAAAIGSTTRAVVAIGTNNAVYRKTVTGSGELCGPGRSSLKERA